MEVLFLVVATVGMCYLGTKVDAKGLLHIIAAYLLGVFASIPLAWLS